MKLAERRQYIPARQTSSATAYLGGSALSPPAHSVASGLSNGKSVGERACIAWLARGSARGARGHGAGRQ